MAMQSVLDRAFLTTVQRWIEEQGDIFVVVRYAASGGARDYFVINDFVNYRALLSSLPARADVIVFRQRQLPIRGIASSQLLSVAVAVIPDGVEWIVVTLSERDHGRVLDLWDGRSHQELTRLFNELRDTYIAAGEDPPWHTADSSNIQSGLIPLADGSVQRATAY